ncbi:MAG: trypsin-like peptidase domain-containing protein [Dehalococcoidia bacterium]
MRWIRHGIVGGMLLAGVLVAGCGGAKASPTPLAGQALAGRDPVRQAEGCAPESNPLALVVPSLVRITTPPDANGTFSSGTGIIIDQGWVLTNQHVVDLAGAALVKTFYRDGHSSSGKVIAADADLDLALVQTDTGDLPPVAWGDEGKLNDKSVLFSVGYELGATSPLARQGRYVSTTVDRATGQAFIVSDLQLQHGDSGGPLLNSCGQVIGINTARIQGVDSASKLGLSIPGFGARRWSARNRPQ